MGTQAGVAIHLEDELRVIMIWPQYDTERADLALPLSVAIGAAMPQEQSDTDKLMTLLGSSNLAD